MYAEFDLEIPSRLDDALRLLDATGVDAALPLSGGTNLVADLRARKIAPRRLVSLARLQGLRGVRHMNGRITIGGQTTISDLLRLAPLAQHGSSLIEAANVFAGQMVRNAATVAGNIACGSPAADLVPPLLSLDAQVVLTSTSGSRTVPLASYFTGYRTDVRRADELITEISWIVPPTRSANRFYKLARRKGDAITVTGVAVALAVRDGVCSKARIALGAVAPVVMRARAAEMLIEGQALTPTLIEETGRRAAQECRPIDDIRASADYRRHAVEVLTRRLISEAWARLT
ncbi:MAG TPA: xanthine dehydrogenase family protein subunit M [Alphaproteobacteria bacterium]|nr:xanthine dehydrogenase family protein subunit M [Alphaproteobacteria bacterium]